MSDIMGALAAYSKPRKVTDAEIKAALAASFKSSPAKASITRSQNVRNLKRPKYQGALSATPKGTLTQQAAGLIGRLTGDTRQSHRIADKLGNVSDFINPASWATNLGHSANQLYRDPTVSNGIDTALNALDVTPVGKGAALLAHGVLPAAKKGIKKLTRRSATLDDFAPGNIQSINDLDDWAIFTAENPMGKQASPEANASAMAALKADLDGEGIQYLDGGVGKYGNHENVITALIKEDRARHFGKKFNQDSVLTKKGLIYHDGSIHPSRGVNTFDEAPEDFYTELPNGSKFAVDIDFDNLKPAPRAAVLRDYIDGGAVNTGSLHSPYSPIKMRKSHDDQTSEVIDSHEFSEAPVMRPEDFKIGSSIVPLVGDRTATGRTLVGLDGRKLSEPLPLEGGARYPHFQSDMGHDGAWASHSTVTNAIANNVQRVANGNDVHGIYSAMGPRSGDFSTMMADALQRQLAEAPIPKGALSSFDAQIRKKFPKFAGISDPARADELRKQLLKKGSLRMMFVKTMDDAKRQSAGFPDVAATRYAISDPTLRNVPEGTSGLTIAKMDTGARPISDPAIPHTSYPSQIKGAFSGGFEVPLSREEVFPDFFKGRRARGVDTFGDRRSFEISSVNQPVDQQWIDSLSTAIERKKANGVGW